MKDANLLPATCGRVCPQETQCEGVCIHPQAIAIGNLERYIGDRFAKVHGGDCCEPSGFKIAIVGSGPSGLTCASELAKKGHAVTVFEALHDFGGVLIYGMPEFRLPKNIVRSDIAHIRELGVEFVSDTLIGRTLTIDDLMDDEGFDVLDFETTVIDFFIKRFAIASAAAIFRRDNDILLRHQLFDNVRVIR